MSVRECYGEQPVVYEIVGKTYAELFASATALMLSLDEDSYVISLDMSVNEEGQPVLTVVVG